ncbi:hypothetical protein INT45_010118 [Circinella minor]|uniref:F-box domain-containing protein n=1 Tax=Circinella minor TaxID=1195481 RepID=A0A8H7RU31_9FUNG|nr:hypothetical protein INT45_010118 [Circinella minor]
MRTSSPGTTAETTIINTAIPIPSFENVKNAYDHREYDEIIRQTTDTIAHIEQMELLWLLERRAYALSMKSKFLAAEHDAETMIEYAPSLPQGYLCFGKLLSMQGKQKRASKVYQEGLEKVATNDLAYGQLLQAKKRVDEKSNYHFDLVSALPIEIMDEIVSLLSEAERSDLFHVSTTWSQGLENCQKAWKYIYNDHPSDDDIAVSRILPKIAKRISHLVITAIEKKVWLKYLEHLEKGHFRNLKSLGLTVMPLMNGFWNKRHTLTEIALRFYEGRSRITITDILFYLPYLETLILEVQEPLANVLGELEALQEPHRSLIDLSLDTSSTSGDALKSLTRWCPYVRRLSLWKTESNALDIVTDYFPNVEMLMYNYSSEPLLTLHEVLNQEYNNNEPIIPIINMNNMYTKQEQGKLRAFYSNVQWQSVSGNAFFRLLQKNQKTLEIIHADLSLTGQEDIVTELDNVFPDYVTKAASAVLNFDRLKKITLWPDRYGAYELLFWRTTGPSLKYFKSFKTHDLPALVDALISSKQLLETLGFAEVYNRLDDQEDTLDIQSWVRLFNEYATTSLPGTNTTKKLRNVMFDECFNMSDDILDVLANIKTIKGLGFRGTCRITRQGFKNFFIKLNKQNVQITKLLLEKIQCRFGEPVLDRDTLLYIISTMEELEVLHLNYIDWLTCDDIEELVHTAKKLNTLVVKGYDIHSEKIISSINKSGRKLKYVNVITGHDKKFDL